MNILEHYIGEIFSVEPFVMRGTAMVKVDLSTNCYGNVRRQTEVFTADEWDRAKEQGYFMA